MPLSGRESSPLHEPRAKILEANGFMPLSGREWKSLQTHYETSPIQSLRTNRRLAWQSPIYNLLEKLYYMEYIKDE